MGRRLQLQDHLESLTTHVYFQPPTNIQLQYPCIVYQRDGGRSEYAGNGPYQHTNRYQVTVIDRDPDSDLADKVEQLHMCTFDRFYAMENLNHFVFNLFY